MASPIVPQSPTINHACRSLPIAVPLLTNELAVQNREVKRIGVTLRRTRGMALAMSHAVSPLARPFPNLPTIAGVTPRVARARYKEWDRCDLTFVTLDAGTAVAGVLTQSKCPSPEVEWCGKALVLGEARALVVNAGNSNAFTGNRGRAAVEAIAARAAGHLGCQPSDVFVASTGVIGVPLPIDKAEAGLDAAFTASPCGWRQVADAIGTTDTYPKGAVTTALLDGRTVTLAGVIKG